MAEPKVRFKQDDGSSYPDWGMHTVGDMTVELTDYKPLSCGLPLLTSARTGLMFQDEYRGKTSTENEDTLFSVVPRGAVTYRHMSDDNIFHFNINDLVDAGLVSKEYPVFNTANGNNIRILVEYLNSSKNFLEFCKAQKKGGTRTRLYFKVLKDFEMMFPCVEEQQKIADFLSSVDDVITASEEEVANLETQKKAVMKKIFSQEVRFKRADGTDFPEWEEKMLGGYCDIVTGKLDANAMVEDGEYDFYTSGIATYKIDVAAFEGPAITIAGNGATVGYMHLADGKFNAYQRTYVLSQFRALREYLFYAIGDRLPLKIRKEARAGNIPYIVMDMLTDLYVPLPCEEEQRLIADFLSDFDEAIAAAKKELELWKELKKGLLQQMFV